MNHPPPQHLQMMHGLEIDGVAIVQGVLNTQECTNLRNGFDRHFNELTRGKFDAKKPETHTELFKLHPKNGMLFQHYMCRMQEIWDLRTNDKIADIFAEIYNVPVGDLTCSVDGASYAADYKDRGKHRNNSLHCDQSFLNNGRICVQSWVTAHDVGPHDGTLQYMEGSHRYHKDFRIHFGLDKDPAKYKPDWFKLEPHHVQWYIEQGCPIKTVTCNAGDMVLWDSRTIHAGRAPLRNRDTKGVWRCVVYVSMMKRSLLSPKDAEKRRRLVLKGEQHTSHWANKHKPFSTFPHTYSTQNTDALKAYIAPLKTFTPPLISHAGAKRAGFNGYCPLTIVDPQERTAAVNAELARLDAQDAARKRARPAGKSKPTKRLTHKQSILSTIAKAKFHKRR